MMSPFYTTKGKGRLDEFGNNFCRVDTNLNEIEALMRLIYSCNVVCICNGEINQLIEGMMLDI